MPTIGLRSRVTLVVAAIAALAVAAPSPAGVRNLTVDRGVVQSITPTQIVLRELDGSVVALAVDASTRVLLNGAPARLRQIKPGFVATVVHDGTLPARVIRAFGRVGPVVDRGVVVSRGAGLLTVQRADGSQVTVRLTVETIVRWRNGTPARRAAIRPGRLVEVTHTAKGVARLVVLDGRRA
jgi:hypothetical protein